MENNTDIRRGRHAVWGLHVQVSRRACSGVNFEAEITPFLWGGHLWSRSYYAGSAGGAPLNVTAEYVKAQDRTAT